MIGHCKSHIYKNLKKRPYVSVNMKSKDKTVFDLGWNVRQKGLHYQHQEWSIVVRICTYRKFSLRRTSFLPIHQWAHETTTTELYSLYTDGLIRGSQWTQVHPFISPSVLDGECLPVKFWFILLFTLRVS